MRSIRGSRPERTRNGTYEEDGLRLLPAGICVLLAKCDELFGEPLGFFCFVPGCGYGFMGEERGDQVAEEGLSVGGFATQMPVFHSASGHGRQTQMK